MLCVCVFMRVCEVMLFYKCRKTDRQTDGLYSIYSHVYAIHVRHARTRPRTWEEAPEGCRAGRIFLRLLTELPTHTHTHTYTHIHTHTHTHCLLYLLTGSYERVHHLRHLANHESLYSR